ncbi:hydroxyacid dehydrogenase [candidate division WWE3 bacterium RIFCSPHIGHO2_01_FULL_42_13]|uniref:Hydroxyacid dehydrogenase n=1 Tax=candidate division WWE3 bacterium RIFCSPHIGHO2_01_FULL_42_13 TaxID=1802617 RepID=A0A1F4URW5_UNCKA|nr:MAG: hydroxyacid dehydrogenase [candidate division WWE3 bacterium RIFCSPHIGHO2_01_FULL_42_13]
MKAKSFAAPSADKPLEYYEFERREPTPTDVELEVHYCGVCHSDLHTAHGDWGEIEYPCVPGHEIVGIVTRVGSAVTKFKPWDRVGVGCMVNSCRECEACKRGFENSCFNEHGPVWTYSSKDPIDGSDTKGGYSTIMVAPEHFVLPLPDSLDMAHAAPLLCAGITTYSPLMRWKIDPGMKVGVIGLGGLGHMGVKYAKAMGAEVWVISSSPEKTEQAKSYGATGVIVSTSKQDMESAAHKFDFLLDTIPKAHDLEVYLQLLNVHGVLCLVGPIEAMPGFHSGSVINGQKSIAGSGIGGIKETQEMLEYSAKNNILPEIEIINIQDINKAWESLKNRQMAKRYVIDMKKSFPSI